MLPPPPSPLPSAHATQADCLYGQMLASAHGLGWLLPLDQIASHLVAEEKYNGNRFGLTVVTGRHTEPPALSATLLAKYSGLAPGARLPARGGRVGADMQARSLDVLVLSRAGYCKRRCYHRLCVSLRSAG
jgi:hypothetical protein